MGSEMCIRDRSLHFFYLIVEDSSIYFFENLVAVPSDFDQSIHDVNYIFRALAVEAGVEHIDQELEDRRPKHKLQIQRIHGQVSKDKSDSSQVFEFLFIFGRVDVVGVVGESSEYFLVVLEQKGIMVVHTVQDQHVQRVGDIFSRHERV